MIMIKCTKYFELKVCQMCELLAEGYDRDIYHTQDRTVMRQSYTDLTVSFGCSDKI